MKRLFIFSFIILLFTALEVLASAPANSEKEAARQAKWKKLHTMGTKVMVQNTIDDVVNYKTGEVVSLYSKGDIKIRLEDGKVMVVRAGNIMRSLAAPVESAKVGDVEFKVGEKVYYPSPTIAFEIPEGKIDTIFENGKVVIDDGILQVKELKQLGKESKCSPQDESICVDDYVLADSYKYGNGFSFEGTVSKIYSNGVVIVKSGNWLHPISVNSVSKRIAATADDADNSGAVISTRAVKDSSGVPLKISPELEPRDATLFKDVDERNQDAR